MKSISNKDIKILKGFCQKVSQNINHYPNFSMNHISSSVLTESFLKFVVSKLLFLHTLNTTYFICLHTISVGELCRSTILF